MCSGVRVCMASAWERWRACAAARCSTCAFRENGLSVVWLPLAAAAGSEHAIAPASESSVALCCCACPPARQDAHNADGTAASRRWRHGGRPAGLVHEPAHHHALLVHGLLRLDSAFSGGHGIANDSHARLVRTCAPPAAALSPETPSTRNEQSKTGNQARCFAAGPGPAACPAGGACCLPHKLLCR